MSVRSTSGWLFLRESVLVAGPKLSLHLLSHSDLDTLLLHFLARLGECDCWLS